MTPRPLHATAYGIALLLVSSLLAACGDGAAREATTYEDVRGEFMGTASGGRDLVVDHETIPGFMSSMMMTLPRLDSVDVSRLERGDKIQFDLIVSRANARITNVRVLPDTTTLDLPDATAAPDFGSTTDTLN